MLSTFREVISLTERPWLGLKQKERVLPFSPGCLLGDMWEEWDCECQVQYVIWLWSLLCLIHSVLSTYIQAVGSIFLLIAVTVITVCTLYIVHYCIFVLVVFGQTAARERFYILHPTSFFFANWDVWTDSYLNLLVSVVIRVHLRCMLQVDDIDGIFKITLNV